MNKAFLFTGIAAIGVVAYDNIALAIGESTGTQLPFIWQGTIASYFSETWLAIFGAVFILLALFI